MQELALVTFRGNIHPIKFPEGFEPCTQGKFEEKGNKCPFCYEDDVRGLCCFCEDYMNGCLFTSSVKVTQSAQEYLERKLDKQKAGK